MVLVLSALLIESCKKEEDAPVSTEFKASNSTFENFRNWTQVASILGPDPAVGAFHGGADITTERYVYQNNDKDTTAGKKTFPKGTVFVKESFTDGKVIHEITAMVKRGGSFNETQNGWEWFVLNTDGTIKKDSTGAQMRGAELLNGMCGGCHYGASIDFVFTKYN